MNSFSGPTQALVVTAQPFQSFCMTDYYREKQEDSADILDPATVYYFKHLIRKYRKKMGDSEGTNVCSGGLQQFLIKQHEKQKIERGHASGQEQSKFESLPLDVKLHIFSYLTATDLCRVSRVCRSWYDITEDNLLWQGLLDRDVTHWSVIGHNTNPSTYKEVGSDWTNKEIYLRCSPEINRLMHQQNALFSNISSMLRYFLPKKVPTFTMFGPGLETSTRSLVPNMMKSKSFEILAMLPGRFGGVGSGFKMKTQFSVFNLSVLYSASKHEREQDNRDRSHNSRLLKKSQNQENDDQFELNPSVRDFCRTLDGFVCIVDASADSPQVESAVNVLTAMVQERWSATHVPVLVLSMVAQSGDKRLPAVDIINRLKLADLNRPWQVRDCVSATLDGIAEGLTWLTEQTQRK